MCERGVWVWLQGCEGCWHVEWGNSGRRLEEVGERVRAGCAGAAAGWRRAGRAGRGISGRRLVEVGEGVRVGCVGVTAGWRGAGERGAGDQRSSARRGQGQGRREGQSAKG